MSCSLQNMQRILRGAILCYNTFNHHARVVKLVYTYALGAYAVRRAGSSPVSRTRFRRHFWYKMAWEKLPISRGFFFISAPILMISVLLRIELGHSTKRPIWQPEYTWLRYLSRALGRVWQIHPLNLPDTFAIINHESQQSTKINKLRNTLR